MHKINILLFLIIVFSSRINGQLDNILGLPQEYNAQQNIDEWEQDISNDIWDEVEDQFSDQDDSPENLLQKLCAQYDLELENKVFICDDLSKNLQVNDHVIRKRQTDDEDDGSGDGSPIESNEEEEALRLLEAEGIEHEVSTSEANIAGEGIKHDGSTSEANIAGEGIKHDVSTSEANVARESIEDEVLRSEANVAGESIEHAVSTSEANVAGESIKQEVTNAETSTSERSTEKLIIKEAPFKNQGLYIEEPSKQDNEEKSTETPSTETTTKQEVHESTTEQIKPVPTDTTTKEKTLDIEDPIKTYIVEKSRETTFAEISTTQEVHEISTEQTKEVPTEHKTEEETKIATDTTTTLSEKNEHSTKTKPFKNQELDIPKEVQTPIKESETESKNIELTNKEVDQLGHGVEEIIPNQSGNAVLTENKDSISDTEKKIRKMAANESIKSEVPDSEEEPKSGASESDGGKKDTKLLIIIGGLVAAVGVAAFAYSIIKKRKTTPVQATSAVVMNGNADVEDAEAGREMKPLMKSPQSNNTVEYTDEK